MPEKILVPLGFKTTGIHCGVKPDPDKNDLALFVLDNPGVIAGVFTQNKVCGAPVKVSRPRVPRATGRGVVISSGNSNACTGQQGIEDAQTMTQSLADQIGCDADDVLVCSTGIIGQFLPMEKLNAGIPAAYEQLSPTAEAFNSAARGMMTTDTVHKQATRATEINGQTVTVSGAAKGAAMIGPNMATMLSVIMTDADLSAEQADSMLRTAVDKSFNCISVEGHTSTSDTVILMASGAAETGPVDAAGLDANGLDEVQQMINAVAEELAQAIVRDGEGADHFIQLDIVGARNRDEALTIAKAVADGVLVKTAIAGADPNWGRIVSAVGFCGVEVYEENISLKINGTLIYEAGAPVEFDEKSVSDGIRNNRDVHIEIILDLGNESLRFWTCDLTTEYVRLNSEYTT